MTEGISNAIKETKDNNEDIDIGAAPVTDQIVDPKIKMNDAGDHDEPKESIDPTWDRNRAIRNVAYYLRAHKFFDYDHRYYKKIEDSLHRLYEEFPKPPLRSIHWEVHKHCDDGFINCLIYLDNIVSTTSLRREDDTITVIRENNWSVTNNNQQILVIQRECEMAQQRDNLTFVPFQGSIGKFLFNIFSTIHYFFLFYY